MKYIVQPVKKTIGYWPKDIFHFLNFVYFILLTVLVFNLTINEVSAGEQAQKALAAVRQLIKSGEVPSDAVIRLVVKQGNINSFWGNDFELKTEWEKQTGILLDANVRPQLAVLPYLRSRTDFDITVSRGREYPDLVHENLIIDLTPFMTKYNFEMDSNKIDGYISPQIQAQYDGKTIAVPMDGDFALLFLRKDLLENPENKAKFKSKFGYEPVPPRTWDEYHRLISFFHAPEKGIYGACEQRDPLTGWMFWMIRYACQNVPNQLLFDDNMKPLINSPQGVAATDSYLETIPYSPPDILENGNDYSYTMPLYSSGKGFSFILTPAAAKVFNRKTTPVKDKVMIVPMPGKIVNNTLVRRSNFIYGNNLVISSKSKYPELAFLYAMWLADPDISTRAISNTAGFMDPFRYNHLNSKQLSSIYTDQAFQNILEMIDSTVPAGTGLPGDNEYITTLNQNLLSASKNEITSKQAMERTAEEWEKITEKYGRANQIKYWRQFSKKFPKKTYSIPPGLMKDDT